MDFYSNLPAMAHEDATESTIVATDTEMTGDDGILGMTVMLGGTV